MDEPKEGGTGAEKIEEDKEETIVCWKKSKRR